MPEPRIFHVDEPPVRRSSPPPAVVVAFLAALCAGLAGALAHGAMGWIAIGGVALGGAYFASRTAATAPRIGTDLGRVRRLTLLLDRGGSTDAATPPEFTDEWAELYQKVNRLAVESKSGSAAGSELEKFRLQAEQAAELLREGKDPLVEVPELRAGPLLPLLEGVKGSASLPVVSHMSLGDEEELVGAGGDALPPDWPKPSPPPASGQAVDMPELESALQDLIREIESLRGTLAGAANGEAPSGQDDPALRTPAQLVDAVVVTAADGIEDLAAGLMRANELASVAE